LAFWFILRESIFPMAALLGIAYFHQKIFKSDMRPLNNLVLYVLLPVKIFHELSLKKIGFAELAEPFLFMVLLTGSLAGLGWVAAKFLRLSKEKRLAFILSVSMINVGNFGISLIYFTYGSDAAYQAILTFVAFNIPLTTLAVYLSSTKDTRLQALKDALKIPIFHATVVALIFASFEIPIPPLVQEVTGYIGQATFPMFTFVFGMQLANIRLSRTMLAPVATASVLRLLISPVLAVIFLTLIGSSGLSYQVNLVQTSAPSPVLPLMYAIRFNRSPDLLAAIIIVTTILSALTMPLVIQFAG